MRLRKPLPYTLVFVHIPKTGGTSLREVLSAVTGKGPAFWIVDPVKDAALLGAMPAETRARLALVDGHMYYGIHELIPRPCVYLTMLRDPVERILSFYSHIRTRPEHFLHEAAKDLSLAECLDRRLTVELDNYMTRALTSLRNVNAPIGGVTPDMLIEAKSHLDGMFVGLTERFDESVQFFRSRLGWRSVTTPRSNASAGRVHGSDLSRYAIELVRARNALDVELYAYARTLFESRLAGESLLTPPLPEPAP